ncbi:MAG TPA: HisA/HisF-related TIM barrel protein, partial [Pseudolabrys sp.]|nr:HisA/HisF-related TIM barrel protein [Pseudolabrys sp.]
MEIIPVIDLKGGIVVHARMGARDRYRPIETPLARGSDPIDVVAGLMALHSFTTLYVADLDAIIGSGDNRAALHALRQAFTGLTLWVDGGIADFEIATAWLQQDLGHLVLGSETQRDGSLAHHLADNRRVVLSLDFRGDAFQGPLPLLAQSDAWPRRVIAMTLHRVGSGSGPDFARLATLKARAGTRDVYAAGGVRNGDDLRALAQAGIAGALVATGLHDGRITAA